MAASIYTPNSLILVNKRLTRLPSNLPPSAGGAGFGNQINQNAYLSHHFLMANRDQRRSIF